LGVKNGEEEEEEEEEEGGLEVLGCFWWLNDERMRRSLHWHWG